MVKPLRLSVVVTSYTMERLHDLFGLLDSIKEQTYPDIEVIFVAEHSTELFERIKGYAAEKGISNIKVVFNDGETGLSAARNLGIERSGGDIIAFVDDDVVLYPDWADGIVQAHKDNSVIGVTGPAFPLWENKSLQWLPEEFYWLISCTAWTGWAGTRVVRGAFGANMSFKREAFKNGCRFSTNAGYTRGYHHQPVSDDLEFSLRLRKKTGKPIIFAPEARVWHRASKQRLSIGFIAARAHQIGCTRRIIRKYYANELGSSEQEQQVLRGILKTLLNMPKELIIRPVVACKKLALIFAVLVSVTAGYLISFPVYAPFREEP